MAVNTWTVYRVSPTYHPIYDGIVGSTAHRVHDYCYSLGALAAKIASRLNAQAEEECDEIHYVAVRSGGSPFSNRDCFRLPVTPLLDPDFDEIPF